jgi:Bacterial PH domain
VDKAQPATRSWAPAFGLVVLAWLAAAVAIAWFLLADDAPGRLLAAVGTVGLVAAALFGSLARPRLSVDDDRVTLRGLTGTQTWPWRRVSSIRVVRHRRLGREIPMLELDVLDSDIQDIQAPGRRDEPSLRMIVLGRLDLNADPEDVLDAIQRIRGLA